MDAAAPAHLGGVSAGVSGRSNFRKTNRRQGPTRPLIERLHDLNKKYRADWPDKRVRLFFRLPPEVEKLIHLGEHQSLLFRAAVKPDGIQVVADTIAEGFEAVAAFVEIYTKPKPLTAPVLVSLIVGEGRVTCSLTQSETGKVKVGRDDGQEGRSASETGAA